MATASEYRWSSDRHFRRRKGLKWLEVERLLSMLGRSKREMARGYRRLMREKLGKPYEKVELWGQAVKARMRSLAGYCVRPESRGSSSGA